MNKLILVIIGILFCSIYVSSQTINIPEDHPTIQQGIDSANDGDTVLVADGVLAP